MKKRLTLLGVMILVLTFLFGMNAFALEKTVVALGADLSDEQRAEVLSLMGLSEEDLLQCEVITITNAQEHEYLDGYLDSSVIGTKCLTSVKMVPAEKGSGIYVTTQNVNYCTTGMYRNALLTAGVEDVEVFVVAPSPMSGTAGLIGAVKAYETMSGEQISNDTMDTAMDELLTTGEITSVSGAEASDVEALIAWLKSKIASGELDTGDEQSVRKAIDEGETTFGVHLSSEEKDRIVSLLKKLDSIGLNGGYLIGQAEKMYEKYGADIVNHTNEAINEAVQQAAEQATKSFFGSLKESFTGFFKGLFGKS